MKNRIWIATAIALVFVWAAADGFAGRGGGGRGGGGGARGGGRPMGGGARPAGGMPGGGARPNYNRTPSFSAPGGGRPAQAPARAAQTPGRAGAGTRPAQGAGGGLSKYGPSAQRPAAGDRPGGGRTPISTLPSTRADVGGRAGIDRRPGASTLPAVGAGAAAGAGLAARAAARPGTLPGLGDGRLGDGRLGDGRLGNRTPEQRRDDLHDRLAGDARPDQLDARPGQLPARDWGQVRQDWQQRRDQVREDWQQHRDDARDDWQNWFDDHYGWYGGWYAGHAPGYWARWDHLWDEHPVAAAVGVTWWGVNALGYRFGYADYSNPYYAESMPAVYAEPVLTSPAEPPVAAEGAAPPPNVPPEGVALFDQARGLFLEGRYEDALKLTNSAIAQMPRDAVLHEFRSLVLFALQRFGESAAAIHPVLDVGPGWDWKTLCGLYPSVEVYTGQLRALEAARKKDPKAADVRFLLGYHYLTCGYPDRALDEFRRAAELQPNDAVAAALVATLSPRDAQPAKAPAGPDPKPVPPDQLVGDWTAAGKGTAKYAMSLRKDGTFSWAFTRGSRKDEAKGVYTVEGNVLAMEPDGGGVLLAELTLKEPDAVRFQIVGGAKGDPGLEFRRRSPP